MDSVETAMQEQARKIPPHVGVSPSEESVSSYTSKSSYNSISSYKSTSSYTSASSDNWQYLHPLQQDSPSGFGQLSGTSYPGHVGSQTQATIASAQVFLPLPGVSNSLTNFSGSSSPGIDTTGQVAPPDTKTRLTATLWEDEGTLCFQVEVRGICVARREDNHFINGTKLLNVAGMTRGRRDGILKSEKVRHAVKTGPMHLKGVWIPYDRALDFANKEKITELLYPLFVQNIGALLYHPTNLSRTSQLQCAAEPREREMPTNGFASHPANMMAPVPTTITEKATFALQRPSLDRAHTFPTPPTSASSWLGTGSMDIHEVQTKTGQPIIQRPTPNHLMSLNVRELLDASTPSPDTPPQSPHIRPATQNSLRHGSPGSPTQPLVVQDINLMEAETADPRRESPQLFGHNAKPNSTDAVSDKDLGVQQRTDITKDNAEEADANSSRQNLPAHGTPNLANLPRDASLQTQSPTLTTSCSSSDSGSSEYEGLLTRCEQKRVLLDRLMSYFYRIFSACPSPGIGTRVHGNSTGNQGHQNYQDSGQPCAPMSANSASLESESTSRPTEKRRNEDGEDNGGDKKRLRSGPNDATEDKYERFACPFFKKNPQRYQRWRTCSGPGWTSVHRVKEHVYRNHSLPISCPRCHEQFETDKLKDEHTRAADRCEDQEPPQFEGVDATQKELLRSRKKTHKGMTENEKWYNMYHIIFPDADKSCIPSPYYEYNTTETSGSPGSEFVQYEQFLRQELPNRVRQQLEVRIEERLNPIEESLRSELVDIVRDMQLQLFDIYRASRTAALDTTEVFNPDTAANTSTGEETSVRENAISGDWSVEEVLQPFSQPPYVEDFQFDSFDGLVFNFSNPQEGLYTSDSGYESQPWDRNNEGFKEG